MDTFTNRFQHHHNMAVEEELRVHDGGDQRLLQQSSSGRTPRRQGSLVRPERERVNPGHRHYHTRLHAAAMESEHQQQYIRQPTHNSTITTTSTTTAETVAHSHTHQYRNNNHVVLEQPSATLDRSSPTRRSVLRRNLISKEHDARHSVEKAQDLENHHPHHHRQGHISNIHDTPTKTRFPDIWKAYCYTITCCFPPFLLKAFGKVFYYLLIYNICFLRYISIGTNNIPLNPILFTFLAFPLSFFLNLLLFSWRKKKKRPSCYSPAIYFTT